MQWELLALIHYTKGFWIHDGPEESPELCCAVAGRFKALIRDFVAAVTWHRREWNVIDKEATQVSLVSFECLFRFNNIIVGNEESVRQQLPRCPRKRSYGVLPDQPRPPPPCYRPARYPIRPLLRRTCDGQDSPYRLVVP